MFDLVKLNKKSKQTSKLNEECDKVNYLVQFNAWKTKNFETHQITKLDLRWRKRSTTKSKKRGVGLGVYKNERERNNKRKGYCIINIGYL